MRWNWIDRILRHDPGERLDAIKVVSLSEDHLHEHFVEAPCMPSSLMIEGMAQTAGILVGAISNFERRVILAKIARAEFHADAFLPVRRGCQEQPRTPDSKPEPASTAGAADVKQPNDGPERRGRKTLLVGKKRQADKIRI